MGQVLGSLRLSDRFLLRTNRTTASKMKIKGLFLGWRAGQVGGDNLPELRAGSGHWWLNTLELDGKQLVLAAEYADVNIVNGSKSRCAFRPLAACIFMP